MMNEVEQCVVRVNDDWRDCSMFLEIVSVVWSANELSSAKQSCHASGKASQDSVRRCKWLVEQRASWLSMIRGCELVSLVVASVCDFASASAVLQVFSRGILEV